MIALIGCILGVGMVVLIVQTSCLIQGVTLPDRQPEMSVENRADKIHQYSMCATVVSWVGILLVIGMTFGIMVKSKQAQDELEEAKRYQQHLEHRQKVLEKTFGLEGLYDN